MKFRKFLDIWYAILACTVVSPAISAQDNRVDNNAATTAMMYKIAAQLGSNWRTALTEAMALYKKMPTSADAAGLFGLALMRAGDISEARRYLAISYNIDHDCYWASLLKGRFLTWDGDGPDALQQLTTLLHYDKIPEIGYLAYNEAYFADCFSIHTFVPTADDRKDARSVPHQFNPQVQYQQYSIPTTAQSGDTIENSIPIKCSADGRFWIVISVNGIPMKMILDTCSEGLIMTKNAAQRAGLHMDGNSVISGATGGEEMSIMDAKEIQIGSLTAKTVPVIVSKRSDMRDYGDGVLGTSILKEFDIVFDMEQMKIEILPQRKTESPRLTYSVPFHTLLGVLYITAKINGRNAVGALDSGDTELDLSYDLAKRIVADGSLKGTTTEYNPGDSFGTTVSRMRRLSSDQVVRIDLATLNSQPYTFTFSPLVGLSALDLISTNTFLETGFHLGTPFFLLHRRVEIDYPNRILYFTKLSQ